MHIGHRAALAMAVPILLAVGCSTDPSDSLAGSYVATVFSVTPTGQNPINALTAGGSLTITIVADNSTTGNLHLPASVTGGAPLDASMTGTVTRNGSTLQFDQSADTFVRDLTWAVTATSIGVVNQTAGGAAFTIALNRQ